MKKTQRDPLLYAIIGALIGGVVVWSITTSSVNNNNVGMMGIRNGAQTTQSNSNALDAHFIEQMIPHHEDAITMATMLKNGTNRPEMSKLADDIIASQTKEINEMRTWLNEWRNK